MRIEQSCIGRFHHFDLARQLYRAGHLQKIYTGYPRSKLRREGLPRSLIETFPWVHAPYMRRNYFGMDGLKISRFWADIAWKIHDTWVATRLSDADAFIGLSGHNLKAGRTARKRGAKWICDHGSSHIIYNQTILREEHRRWNAEWLPMSEEMLERIQIEFSECDRITIPSQFVEKTFLDNGVSPEKLSRIAYGVDLSRFEKIADPPNSGFVVTFVGSLSVRKGVPYLVEAFRRLRVAKKKLQLIGPIDKGLSAWLGRVGDADIHIMGPKPQSELKQYLSRSHLFALASVEEGLALVQAQALACGCPVLCTENTGGGDIITEGAEGFIVPARSAAALAEKMELVAGDRELQRKMSAACITRVRSIGGWDDYGNKYIDMLNSLCTS